MISDESVFLIVNCYPSLIKLVLDNCGISNKGATVVSKLKGLKELDIKSGYIDSFVILKLVNNLKALKKLEYIFVVRGELELIQLKNFSFEESKIEIKFVMYPKKIYESFG